MGVIIGQTGQYAIWASLLLALLGIVFYLVGYYKRKKTFIKCGQWTAIGLLLSTSLAVAALQYLLVTSDFRFRYVVLYTSSDLDPFYKVTALWAGNAGSLLLWLWVLSVFAALVALSRHKDYDIFLPHVMPVMFTVILFFSGVLTLVDPPFQILDVPREEGNGLNPLLQNPGMALHPITLYFGYIGFTVPFAYAIAALWLKKTDAIWLYVTRRWTVLSWLFLSLGILYGGKWGYEELGFGGYWVWDPVENASFMPWLTATAFLHSAIVQERKGMLKRWNMILIILTFLLTIFGTFLTRSGVLWSVHAFATGPVGPILLGFIGVMLTLSLALLIWR
ncbi:cytochrome c biogenesis protein CcsA [Caldalkalibacillus thermarum TA2.A1]|nr:cytochrome c biogenesis protein CcsA [Caldalkalibacillus thermarum]QZT35032.1 cytochrome c biogenesis protein CcsA [Caldalkalibacillus thermarum TA2.A1]